jgi:hypothetical protein
MSHSGLANEECELSIVMPCLNEIETLETCIKKAQAFLEKSGVVGEIVIADNGSTDGSRETAVRCGARLVDVPVRGYGAAIYHGSMAARGKYIIMGDSDDSYDFSSLGPFVDELRNGYDLVMGNRFRGGIAPGAMPWKNRYIGNPALTTIGRILFPSKIRDFHCGLRGYSREAFVKMDLQTTGMEFASEMVIKATLRKLRITEIPTTLSPDGRSRPPHLRPWRDGWRHLRFMLLMSPNMLFIYPGALLAVVGLLLGGLLEGGPLKVGVATLDVTTLLYAMAMVVLGTLSMLCGMLARVLAVSQNLLPKSRLEDFLASEYTLEAGVVSGVLLGLLGVAGGIWGTHNWMERGFGTLDPSKIFRIAIPSTLLLCIGAQLSLSSLLFGALRLGIRQPTASPEETKLA